MVAPIINKEQGGSVLNVASTGSIVVASGGKVTVAGNLDVTGTFTNTGATTVPSAGAMTVADGGSLTLADGGAFAIGNVGFSTGKAVPSNAASPGAFYFRSDGANSSLYVNVSSGTTGSVWKSACIVD